MRNLEDLIKIIVEEYKVEENFILKKHSRCIERQMLIYLASTLCRGRYTLTELGNRLELSLGGICRSRYNIQNKIKKDPVLRKKIDRIKKLLVKAD